MRSVIVICETVLIVLRCRRNLQSTSTAGRKKAKLNETTTVDIVDNNEDLCAMCRGGGEEVMTLCRKCPKVFHRKCHTPSLLDGVAPAPDWQCFWCRSHDEIMELKPKEGESGEDFVKSVVNGKIGRNDEDPGKFLVACKFLTEVYKIEEGFMVGRNLDGRKVSGK
jgi:hypothetical protein